MLDAAARLFATRGYHATTFAAIAAEAGVSAETVKVGGSKSALLIAAFEMRFAGTESAPSLTDTGAGAGSMDLPDDVVLDAIVERIVAANARAYALWTVLLGAAGADELVAGALEEMFARRRADYRRLVAELVRRSVIPAQGDPDALADELSFLMSPEGYQQLVAQSGWQPDRYRRWIGDQVIARAQPAAR
ncbi:TetR/AcrR family transcriptional regulator [Microbacterium lacticum]|uniref:TetR/AcrR family transcriptional regulator n=1 Tax=Microbacterium lacticum TaxID=33885 RepID=UPI001F580A56|nr:helix-turn-helix domain-containing protein [Microbacterium lacticum]